jgi:hypothetical protein
LGSVTRKKEILFNSFAIFSLPLLFRFIYFFLFLIVDFDVSKEKKKDDGEE